MPRPDEDVPAVYAAWQDWAAAAGSASVAPETLSIENWDEFAPAARHAAFAALRKQDPAQASLLLMDKIAGESADRRLRLLETLATALSDVDRPLLERLTGDRGARVKELAIALLARLGHGGGGDEDGMDLAAFFTIQTKGLLRRTRVIVPEALKTPARRNRRATLFETLSYDGFAQALGLSATDLTAAWPWGQDLLGDQQLAAMAARSGSDTIVDMIADAASVASTIDAQTLVELSPRLTPYRRRQVATRLLGAQDSSFATALAIVGGDGGIDEATRTAAGTALLGLLASEDARPGDHADALLALGLIASRSAARQALDDLAAAGLVASDPRLDMLRLNAALDTRRPTE